MHHASSCINPSEKVFVVELGGNAERQWRHLHHFLVVKLAHVCVFARHGGGDEWDGVLVGADVCLAAGKSFASGRQSQCLLTAHLTPNRRQSTLAPELPIMLKMWLRLRTVCTLAFLVLIAATPAQ